MKKFLSLACMYLCFALGMQFFNESTAEAAYGTYKPIYKEVFARIIYAYTEDDIDYYVSACGAYRDVYLGSYSDYNTCDVYAASIKRYRLGSPHFSMHIGFTTEYDFYLRNSEWWYGESLGDNMYTAAERTGRVSENVNAQKVFNIIYPKMQWLMRESESKAQRIAEKKRREEQRIAEEKRRKAEEKRRAESERKRIAEENRRRKEAQFNSFIAQGDSYYIAKNYVAAIQSYDKAKHIDKNSVDKFYSKLVKNGDRLNAQGQYLAALDYYKKAAVMYPVDDECQKKPWNTYKEMKNFDDAVSFYTAITTVYPEYKDAWFKLSYSCYEIGNYDRAVVAYTTYIELNPNLVEAYHNRGLAYHKLGQNERAIKDYNKALELNPNYAEAYNSRGIAYQGLKQNERAIKDYNKAIKLNPNNAIYYNWRGWAYEQLKKYKKALKDYQQALELNPNNEFAQKGIERVFKMK